MTITASDVAHAVIDGVEQELLAVLRPSLLNAYHGVTAARTSLAHAVEDLQGDQREQRIAADARRQAAEALTTATIEAEWELDGRFETVGNKTFLVTDEQEMAWGDDPDNPGVVSQQPTGSFVRRQMTADERKAWKANEASKAPAVSAAKAALAKAETAEAAARDAVTLADKRLSACRADLTAAVALLTVLSAALSSKETSQ